MQHQVQPLGVQSELEAQCKCGKNCHNTATNLFTKQSFLIYDLWLCMCVLEGIDNNVAQDGG